MSSNHHAARAALIALATASIATLAGCGKDPKQGCDGLAAAASAAVAAGSVAPEKAGDVDGLVKQITEARDRVHAARENLVSTTISVDAVHLEQRLESRVALLRKAFAPAGAVASAAPAPSAAPEAPKAPAAADFAARLKENARAIEGARDEALAGCLAK